MFVRLLWKRSAPHVSPPLVTATATAIWILGGIGRNRLAVAATEGATMTVTATTASQADFPWVARPVWRIDTVRSLGTTTDIGTAAAILGIGRTKGYQLAKEGAFPVAVLRIGRRYVVPVPCLLKLLGADS
jgi:hypothetical protein